MPTGDKPSARSLNLIRRLPAGAPQPKDGRVGVGVSFSADTQGNHVIQHLIDGGTAQQSGQVHIGDIIFAVDSEPVQGLSVHDVVDKIKGEPESEVSMIFISRKAPRESQENLASSAAHIQRTVNAAPRGSPRQLSDPQLSEKERMLAEQLEAVRRVREEQQHREMLLQAQQQALLREQEEIMRQKELFRSMQAEKEERKSVNLSHLERDPSLPPPGAHPHASLSDAGGQILTKRWDDGKVYKGEFKDGRRHGRGTIIYPDGSAYDGEWLADLRHGQGEYRYADGTYYKGSWDMGNRNGLGMCQYADGNRYEGEWRDNLPHGAGSCRFQEGSVYKGEFVEGKMHGFGTLYGPNGGISFQGEWRNGEKLRSLHEDPYAYTGGTAGETYPPMFPVARSPQPKRSLSPPFGHYPTAAGRALSPIPAHPPRYEHAAVSPRFGDTAASTMRPDAYRTGGGGDAYGYGGGGDPYGGGRPLSRDGRASPVGGRVSPAGHVISSYDDHVHHGMPATASTDLSNKGHGMRCGVGLKLSQRGRGHPIIIEKIQRGGAADLDGRMQVGDMVIRVDGISVSDAENAGVLIQGSPGTTVSIVAERPTGPYPSPVEVVQATLQRRSLSIKRTPEERYAQHQDYLRQQYELQLRQSQHLNSSPPRARADYVYTDRSKTPQRMRHPQDQGPNDCPTM